MRHPLPNAKDAGRTGAGPSNTKPPFMAMILFVVEVEFDAMVPFEPGPQLNGVCPRLKGSPSRYVRKLSHSDSRGASNT